MNLGKGIAIAGIWVGVGIWGMSGDVEGWRVAVFAVFATIFVCLLGENQEAQHDR